MIDFEPTQTPTHRAAPSAHEAIPTGLGVTGFLFFGKWFFAGWGRQGSVAEFVFGLREHSA